MCCLERGRKLLNNGIILNLNDLDIQATRVSLGKKEFEEFCIANTEPLFNIMNTWAGNKYNETVDISLWTYAQENYEELLKEAAKLVDAVDFISWYDVKGAEIPMLGDIYLITHNKKGLLYIGECYDLNKRHKVHSKRTRFSAFRRDLATDLLGLTLRTKQEIDPNYVGTDYRRMYLAPSDDEIVNVFLNDCMIKLF